MTAKKYVSIILVLFFVVTIIFCGCIEEVNDDEEPIDEIFDYDIIGTWIKVDTIGNMTFNISYIFYLNMSFFTGVQNATSSDFEVSIWGTYSISGDIITLTTQNPFSNSSLSFVFSEDNKSLLLFYEDNINFDVFEKVE